MLSKYSWMSVLPLEHDQLPRSYTVWKMSLLSHQLTIGNSASARGGVVCLTPFSTLGFVCRGLDRCCYAITVMKFTWTPSWCIQKMLLPFSHSSPLACTLSPLLSSLTSLSHGGGFGVRGCSTHHSQLWALYSSASADNRHLVGEGWEIHWSTTKTCWLRVGLMMCIFLPAQ